MEEKPQISIIVPAYNVEKYIEQCLTSVINQTYKNLEIIVVNDGSKDKTGEIIEKLARRDKRIVYINQENKGVAEARNTALQKVTSEFVMFVDSDDWIDLETCEVAMNELISENADVVMFGYVREYSSKSLPKAMFDENKIIFEGEDVKNKLHRRFFGPIGEELKTPEKLNANAPILEKLYRTSILKDIKFVSLHELGLCEDGYFNISVFKNVKKAVFIKKHFYHYRKVINGGSLTQNKDCDIFEKEKMFYNKLDEIIENENLPDEYKIALDNRMAISLIESGIMIVNSNCNVYENIRKILKSKEYKNACESLTLEYFPLHWKVFFGLAKAKCVFGVLVLLKIILKLIDKR